MFSVCLLLASLKLCEACAANGCWSCLLIRSFLLSFVLLRLGRAISRTACCKARRFALQRAEVTGRSPCSRHQGTRVPVPLTRVAVESRPLGRQAGTLRKQARCSFSAHLAFEGTMPVFLGSFFSCCVNKKEGCVGGERGLQSALAAPRGWRVGARQQPRGKQPGSLGASAREEGRSWADGRVGVRNAPKTAVYGRSQENPAT